MNEEDSIRCFISMPAARDFHEVRGSVVKVLEDYGIRPLSLELSPTIWPFLEAMQQRIERADFVVADLTGNNPNVMYEVGFSHALRKPVIPIVRATAERIPSALAGFYFLVYDPADLDRFRAQLTDEIQDLSLRGGRSIPRAARGGRRR